MPDYRSLGFAGPLEVGVRGDRVVVTATHMPTVALTPEQQEAFATLYVAACHEAEASARAVTRAGDCGSPGCAGEIR